MRAEADSEEDRERAIERMRFALGVDDDYREVYETFRADRLFGSAIRQKPLAPAAPAALGLGGAGLVDHQAADRVLARGRDPAPDGVPLGRHPRGRRRPHASGRPGAGADRRPRAGRARGEGPVRRRAPWPDSRRARGRRRPGGSGRHRRRSPAAARSARSAPGRSSAWASTAAASPTRCPPATSATSSWSAAWPASAAAPRSRRWRSSSRPYEPFRGLAGDFMLVAHHKAIAQGRRCGWRPEHFFKAPARSADD